MVTDPAQEAIVCALKGEWERAIDINEGILSREPEDISALNRLARAHSELGNFKKAKSTAKKVLKIDPFNTIAKKCLQKWNSADGNLNGQLHKTQTNPKTFLEEPGKTKITHLLHLGDNKTLGVLDTGDELILNAFQHRVSVTTHDGNYIGRLTDDLSARLRKLIKNGNKYDVLVKSVEPGSVKVFIRETSRAPKHSDTPSFPPEKIDYVSFTPPELVHQKEIRSQDDE